MRIGLETALGRGLLVGAVSALIVLLLWTSDAFTSVRLRLSDLVFVPEATTDQIVIVAIDDASLARFGRAPTLWDRTHYADFLANAAEAGARVIAFDMLFAERAPGDDLFVEALADLRARANRPRVVMPLAGTGTPRIEAGSVIYDDAVRPLADLTAQVDLIGFANIYPDVDNVVRRQPSQVQVDNDAPFSGVGFPIAVYLAYLRVPSAAVDQVVTRDPAADTLFVTPQRAIPIDENGFWRQYYFGGAGAASLPVISFARVADNDFDPELLAGRIVLVGTLGSTGMTDQHLVPSSINGRLAGGVEIVANAIETLIQNRPVIEQPRSTQVLMISILAFAAGLTYTRLRWYFMPLMWGVYSLIFFVVVFVLFSLNHRMINLFHGALALAVPVLLALGVTITREIRQRQRAELLLQGVSSISGQPLDLDALLPRIAQGLREIVGANAGTLWLDSAHTGAPHTYQWGGGAGAEGAIPLMWQGRQIGRLAIRSDRRVDPQLLEHFARSAAPMLENAALYGETRRNNALLEEANWMKTQMIRAASHDIKNPVGQIMGFVDLMHENPELFNLNDRAQTYLMHMRGGAEKINRIITSLLNIEQLRTTKIAKSPLPLAPLLTALLPVHQVSAEQRQITLTCDFDDATPPVLGSSEWLEQVFDNLIGNAIKYTPDGGSVTVRLLQHNGHARVEVQDTGYGIPKDQQDKLFQAFYRAQSRATAHITGTGLGLSLVKSIVDAHNGRVWLESDEGKGSTFYVDLPLVG